MKCKLDCKGGHMFVSMPEGVFLVDTGSPTSFSRSGRLSFADRAETMPTNAMGMLDADELSGHVGENVDGLIGMDVLSRHLIVFDGDEMLVDECPIPDSAFTVLESDSFMGIPVVPIQVAGQTVRVFLDTGAKVSYLAAACLENCHIDERLSDFYPGLGRFDVEVLSVPCEVAGFHMKARFGRLPALLQMTLLTGGVHGILGRDLFAKFRVRLDAGGSSVSIARREKDSCPTTSISSRNGQTQSPESAHMREGAAIHFETDDIFANAIRNGYHGIALVVPLGLTAFRVLASDFVKKNGMLLSADSLVRVFDVNPDNGGSLFRIVEIQTSRFKPFCKVDATAIIERVFAAFEAAGCRTIGMNGVKIGEDDRSRNQFLSEHTTVDAVRKWVRQHPDSIIRDIYLVDKRGGFEQVDSENTHKER